MKSDLSRRDFFKGLGIAAAGTAAVGLVGCGTGNEPIGNNGAVGLPDTWDYETDVVVVGYGGAGAITAINAADNGAEVIIIEKYQADTDTEVIFAPSARYCGAQCVLVDDPVKGSKVLEALSFGTVPKDICDAWGEGAYTNYEYLLSLGAEYGEPQWDACEYDFIEGAETIGTTRIPGTGPRMFQVFMENVEDRADKIKVIFDTPGYRLIRNEETKEICGVVAKQGGNDINIKARKGVALCTGGFEFDEEMKMNFLRGYPDMFYGNPLNTGEGIRMGQAVGGALWHMNAMSARAIPYHPDWPKATGIELLEPYIFVNQYAKRWFFEAEWSNHNAWLEFVHFDSRHVEYPTIPSWIIYDDSTDKPFVEPNVKGRLGDTDEVQYWGPQDLTDIDVAVSKGWILKGNTAEELAAVIAQDPDTKGHFDPAVFAATIERYNQFCVEGKDADFDRDVETMVPLQTPPYYALKLYPGGPNTQGGLKKNAKAQVLDVWDEPIKRLYCVGENGSVYGFLYPRGGGNVCEFVIFGRIAGKELAAETPWE
jgi:hypothetical protein